MTLEEWIAETEDDTATDARTGRKRRQTLLCGCGGLRGNPAGAARQIRADTTESLRVLGRLTYRSHAAVAGLEHRVGTTGIRSR